MNSFRENATGLRFVTLGDVLAVRTEFIEMKTKAVAEWPAFREQLAAAKNKLVSRVDERIRALPDETRVLSLYETTTSVQGDIGESRKPDVLWYDNATAFVRNDGAYR